MIKKILLLIALFTGILFVTPHETFAACGTIRFLGSTGNVCELPGGESDFTFTTCGNPGIAGESCCQENFECPSPSPNAPNANNQPEQTSGQCGRHVDVNGETQCWDEDNNVIPGADTCERNSTVCCATAAACENVFAIENIIEGPGNDFFDAMNPLRTEGDPALADQLSTPGGIVSRLLQFLFPLAGLILFVMLIWGGFEILSKAGQSQKALEAGKNRITAAIVGFLLLFATYWMAQILQTVFGIVIV